MFMVMMKSQIWFIEVTTSHDSAIRIYQQTQAGSAKAL